jgi:beta-lactamase regulating signal transducer with metallopeptidase domain
MNELLDLAIRATILLGVAVAGWWLLKGGSAQLRSTWLRAVVVALVALPVWIWAGPELKFVVPFAEKPAPVLMSTMDGAVPVATTAFNWAWVWIAIASLLAIRMVLGGWALTRMWSQARRASDDLTDELYQALARLDVVRPVEFRLAPVTTPMTFGIHRACVVVPSDFESWPEGHREAALMHEAAHIRRFDCGWQWLATAVRAMLWCHPMVWWLTNAIRDEAELAADEHVIAAGVEATDYASALVEIARNQGRAQVPVAATALMREGQLSRRVTRALESRRAGFTPLGSLGLMSAAMAAVMAIGGLRPQLPQADVVVLGDQVFKVASGDPAEDVPVEIDHLLVPIDAGLAPLPSIPSKEARVTIKKTIVSAPTHKAPVARVSTPVVAPSNIVIPTEIAVDEDHVSKELKVHSADSMVKVVVNVGEPVAPRSDARRVVVLSTTEAANAKKAPGAYAYHFIESKDFKDLADLKDFKGEIPNLANLEQMAGFASAADREEFKRHMELLHKELLNQKELIGKEFIGFISEAEAKKMAEKTKKALEEARKVADKFAPPAPPATATTLPTPPVATSPSNGGTRP